MRSLIIETTQADANTMDALSDKARKFIAKNPTLIGVTLGHRFYEHPTRGDESPLVMITPDGKVKLSAFFEVPDALELANFMDYNANV